MLSLSKVSLAWSEAAVALLWTGLWWYGTSRIVVPSSRPTIAFCFEVELEGERNYRKVIRKIRKQLSDLELDRDIRVLQVGPGAVASATDAERYCAKFGIQQVVWGIADYGTIKGKELLKFDVNHFLALSEMIEQNLNLLKRDYAILRDGRPFTIQNEESLIDVEVVADDFLEISLGLIAIQALIRGATNDAVKILSLVVPRLQARNQRAATKERSAQARRLAEILHGAMMRSAVASHEAGDHAATVSLIQKLLPAYPTNINIRLTIARAFFYLGDIKAAVQQTSDVLRIDKSNPAAFTNQAFFSILRKKYDEAGKWYERLRASRHALSVSLETVTKFLDERYEEAPNEHGYLFGLAIVNGLDDPAAMRADLQEFLEKTETRPEYASLRKRANEILAKCT